MATQSGIKPFTNNTYITYSVHEQSQLGCNQDWNAWIWMILNQNKTGISTSTTKPTTQLPVLYGNTNYTMSYLYHYDV